METNKIQQGIIKRINKEIEKGRYGKIDYHWDGEKRVRDNIIFAREEFQSILKETLKDYHQTFRKDIKNLISKIQVKVTMCWKGQNEFLDWLRKEVGDKLWK